ncbi:hypothetical protein MMC22_010651, partial [Lobaria immixta]|nr:hypothetical protein [Lobaria immixta]
SCVWGRKDDFRVEADGEGGMPALLILGWRCGVIWIRYIFIPFQTDPVETIHPIAINPFSPGIPMIHWMKSQTKPATATSIKGKNFCGPEHGLQSGSEILAQCFDAATDHNRTDTHHKRTSEFQFNDPEVGESTQSSNIPLQRGHTGVVKAKSYDESASDDGRVSKIEHEVQELSHLERSLDHVPPGYLYRNVPHRVDDPWKLLEGQRRRQEAMSEVIFFVIDSEGFSVN